MTDPGIWTSIVLGIMVGSNFPFSTKFSVTKEWDAPESNSTLARVKLTRNVPRTISGSFQGVHSLDPDWVSVRLGSAHRVSSGALLREVPWLSTGIATTSLATVGRVEDVAVSSRRIPAGGAVA
jgi:hypothetical protein